MDCTLDEPPNIKQEPSFFGQDEDGAPILPNKDEDEIKNSSFDEPIDSNKTVKFGKFGDISKLMQTLASRDDSFIDLDLICADKKVLSCHKFILGAQSSYLRQILLSIELFGGSSEVDNRCKMNFPDVEAEHMEVILKFLYTG